MDPQIRLEIDTINRRLGELASCVQTIQALIELHEQTIVALQQPLRDPARAHDPQ